MMQQGVKLIIVAEIFPLHDAEGSQIFLQQFAVGSQILLLHDAAGGQISNSNNHDFEAKDEKILGCESGTQVDTSDGKNRR
jgi:hypothetical protein